MKHPLARRVLAMENVAVAAELYIEARENYYVEISDPESLKAAKAGQVFDEASARLEKMVKEWKELKD